MLIEPVNALARWHPWGCLKCVCGLRRLEKNLKLFRMNTCLWPGAQMWFRQRWRKLVTASVLFHFIDGYSCLRYWNEFFSGMFQVLDWSFLVLHSDGSVCNWIPKVIWQRMDWFWVFCWEIASLVDFLFVWTEICKNRLIVALFWGHQIFSMFSSSGFLVCSSKMLVYFRQKILWYRLTSCRTAMQLYTLSRFVVEPIFLGSSDKCLWLLLKTK